MLVIGDVISLKGTTNTSFNPIEKAFVLNINDSEQEVCYYWKRPNGRYDWGVFFIPLDIAADFEINEEVDVGGVGVTKIADNTEFLSQLRFRIGDRVLTYTGDRYDGQIFEVTKYVVSRDYLYYSVSAIRDGYRKSVMEDDLELVPENYVVPEMKEYRCCDRCGDEFVYDENSYPSNEEAYLCPTCMRREYVSPYHRFTPPLVFFPQREWTDGEKYLGVELEVEYGGESDRIAGEVVRDMRRDDGTPFVWVSHDSSLSSGFEIITQPATIEYHRSLENEYKNLFKKLVSYGYRGHQSLNAGLHVHFSRSYFGDKEETATANLLYLVEKFWNEIQIFSRRDYDRSKYYMRLIGEDYDIDEYMDKFNKSGDNEGHHYAVSITNYSTIELRFFKSTLNTNAFMCVLEFANSLIEAVKNKSTSEIWSMEFDELLTPRTREYYESRLRAHNYEEV